MHFLIYRIQFVFLAVCSIMLTACMAGPDFHSPPVPKRPRYTRVPLPAKTVKTPLAGESGKAQTFLNHRNVPAEWWYLFHSKALNQLIRQGLGNGPTLASAYAALRSAQEALNIQIGNSLFPAFDASLSGSRQLDSAVSLGLPGQSNIFNLFNVSVNVSYMLDVFGGARRQIESLRAQVDYQQFQLIAARLTLTSNIVTTAVTMASLQAQIQATHELIAAQEDQLYILKQQFRLGGISRENILTQQTLVNQTRATLPPLQKSLSQSRHALSALIGNFPDCPLPEIKLSELTLPTTLPVSLPSLLVRQRPDVRASEALLHAASASIGAATANLFPQFNITGNDGWESTIASQLFKPVTRTWTIGSIITQPFFHGGALLAQRRQAIAQYDQVLAEYRQTVLQAFQNVADTLRALETDARALRAQKTAEYAALASLQLIKKQYQLGGASYLSLLNAQQQYQSVRIAAIQAQAARYTDTAALFQALGGGWWNRSWCVKEGLQCS